ncbi:MAG TPA: glycerophosphodiester phosphodiesterase [Candidatus Limnocylindrales bacterium]|nr:glycerophosphodiester phosphodiesterase [Candidatus Limnocylindrales bacterium]
MTEARPGQVWPAGQRPRVLRLAHRGDHRRQPENSLAAMLAAMDVPDCDGLEFDVRASRDGIPVLLHDESLARVQGVFAEVGTLTAAELAGHGVPSLAAVLAQVPRRAFLDVELKADLGRAVVEVLAAGRGADLQRAVISSFEIAALERIRSLAPAWPCWLNTDHLRPGEIRQARELGCVGIAVDWHGIDAAGLARARSADLEVVAWTVTDLRVSRRLEASGISAMCLEGRAFAP